MTFAVCSVAVLIRVLLLAHRSVWLDEATSVYIARLNWTDFVRLLWQREANMTLYYLLLRPMLYLGDSEFVLRLIPALAGIATLPVMFALGKKIFNTRIGWLSAMLLAVNAGHIAYSQEARGYSMAVLFCAISTLLFLQAVEGRSAGTWLLYAVVSGLAVYCHFYAGLVLIAQWASMAAIPKREVPWKHLLLSVMIVGLLAAPAAVVVLTHDVGQLGWIPAPSLLEVYHTAVLFAGSGGKLLGDLLIVLSLTALVVAGRSVVRDWKSAGLSLQHWRIVLVWSWFLVPIALTLLLSLTGKPTFFHRYLLVCLPAFVLLVAQGLAKLRRANVLIGIFVVFSLSIAVIFGTRAQEDWRGATSYVVSHAQPGDGIFICRDYGYAPFTYYESRLQGKREGLHPVDPEKMQNQSDAPSRLWVILYPYPSSDELVNSATAHLAGRYPVLQEARFRRLRVVLLDFTRHD
jgi:uncharacterized membrane protein